MRRTKCSLSDLTMPRTIVWSRLTTKWKLAMLLPSPPVVRSRRASFKVVTLISLEIRTEKRHAAKLWKVFCAKYVHHSVIIAIAHYGIQALRFNKAQDHTILHIIFQSLDIFLHLFTPFQHLYNINLYCLLRVISSFQKNQRIISRHQLIQ